MCISLESQSFTEHIAGQVGTTWMNVTTGLWRRWNYILVPQVPAIEQSVPIVSSEAVVVGNVELLVLALSVHVYLFWSACVHTMSVDEPRNMCFDKPVY